MSSLFENGEKIQSLLDKSVNEGVFPGAAAGFGNTEEFKILFSGSFRGGKKSPLVREDSIFDIASVTKSIPTASLALKAWELGKIKLTDKLNKIIPELSMPYGEQITFLHLLNHTLDWGFALSSWKNKDPKKIIAGLYSAALKGKPGCHYFYSNATSLLLGIAVERIFGESLSELADKYFFQPLDMLDTGWKVNARILPRVLPSEIDPWRGREIRGEVHDESAFQLSKIMNPGSAGLFSTVPDLLKYLKMLLNEGRYGEKCIFSKKTWDLISRNYLGDLNLSTGLGWELNQKRYMGNLGSRKVIGKTGFTGCLVVCDMEKKVGGVLLANYTYPHRKPGPEAMNRVRKKFCDIIFGG